MWGRPAIRADGVAADFVTAPPFALRRSRRGSYAILRSRFAAGVLLVAHDMAVSRVDTEHLEALVRRHQETVRGFLRFMGCPPRLVDDLVQEVFLSVLASPFEDRAPEQTAAYLRKVARHLLARALRREARQPLALDVDDAEATWTRFEGDDGGRGYLDALRECVQRLVGTAAEVVRLRYHDALALADIGARLRLSDAGVKSVLLRTRARLRECVERKLA